MHRKGATPEKALCDKIVMTSGVFLRSVQQTNEFLMEDLRIESEDLLEASPSLRREFDALVKRQGTSAAKLAAHDLEDHGEPAEAVWARLEKGGFTAEQVLGDWFPEAPG